MSWLSTKQRRSRGRRRRWYRFLEALPHLTAAMMSAVTTPARQWFKLTSHPEPPPG